jgi:hypothetical protein
VIQTGSGVPLEVEGETRRWDAARRQRGRPDSIGAVGRRCEETMLGGAQRAVKSRVSYRDVRIEMKLV